MKKNILNLLRSIYRISGIKSFLESNNVIDLELHPLEGDRAIEYPWCFSPAINQNNLKILDIGPVQSPLTGFAWRYGHNISSVDLRDLEYTFDDKLSFYKMDVQDCDFSSKSFNLIMLCSVIEHIGLDNRYKDGAVGSMDADLNCLKLCKKWIKDDGVITLTIPVGLDDVIFPKHRIYGKKRLSKIFNIIKPKDAEYWKKINNKWIKVEEEVALSTDARIGPYALGLFKF
jgi:hypothetical protein